MANDSGYTGADRLVSEQADRAFQLKLQSAKLEQEHQSRLSEFSAQKQAAVEAAGTAYERSKTDPDTSDTLRRAAGSEGSGPLSSESTGALAAIVKLKQEASQTPGDNHTVLDPNGLPWYTQSTNLIGHPTHQQFFDNHDANSQAFGALTTYTQMAMRAHSLYQDLSVHNAFGLGDLINMLPADASTERAQLNELNAKMGPIEAQVFEKLPGVRYSQALGTALAGPPSKSNQNEAVEADMFGNGMLLTYQGFNSLAPTAHVPPVLGKMFGNLPHDIGGKLVGNASDYSVNGGKLYDVKSGQQVLDLGNPAPAIHPATTKAVMDFGAQQATAGQTSMQQKMAQFKADQAAKKAVKGN